MKNEHVFKIFNNLSLKNQIETVKDSVVKFWNDALFDLNKDKLFAYKNYESYIDAVKTDDYDNLFYFKFEKNIINVFMIGSLYKPGVYNIIKAIQAHEIVIKPGDFINWESAGMIFFPEPQLVTDLSECGQFLFVQGSRTGIPLHETILIKKGS